MRTSWSWCGALCSRKEEEMHAPEDIFYIVGLGIAVIEVIRSRGLNYLAWAVGIICIGLLWHIVG